MRSLPLLVLISGPPGVGKSTLVVACSAQLRPFGYLRAGQRVPETRGQPDPREGLVSRFVRS